MSFSPKSILTLAASVTVVATASSNLLAAPVALSLPGNTQFDGFNGITSGNNTGFPSFGNSTSAWPRAIESNVAGSGDATLTKLANGAGGGPIPGTETLYFFGFNNTPNTFGGTIGINDATPVANLNYVALQVEIGGAHGYDLYSNGTPVLTYNGGSTQLEVTSPKQIVSQIDTGATFTNPVSGLDEPIYRTTYLYQWDLSSIVDPITSFTVAVSGVQHAQIYALQLDQSDVASVVAVPEPASLAMIGLGAAALLVRKRKSAAC